MGEVVVSSEETMDMAMEKNEQRENGEKMENKEGSSSMVRWEKFLPSIALRVLLVEADDSTRQIIGALLRKCSYKVASVPDGLKAWEVLKARPHNIDLILTEVELPSISGYALLTLIMEHEICKNIPVIMMSTHDSVSTVYKCMLRGAADFLVKPIRTNELKNLWQHVWRRQSMTRQGIGPQDESVAEQKMEATAENNATSDYSISSKTCSPRQEEGLRKGSDAQSSCGKPVLEAESGHMAEEEDQLLPIQMKSAACDLNKEHSNYANSGNNLSTPESAVAGSHTASGNGNHTLIQDRRLEQRSSGGDVNPYTEASSSTHVHNSSSEAIDLIGALHNHSRLNSCLNDGANKFESTPELDLSLRRFHSDVLENKGTYEKQMLNHSNASAFTRYVNKPLHMSNGNVTSVYTSKGDKVNAGDHSADNASGSNTKAKDSPLPYERKVISLPINPTKEVENDYQTAASQRLFPIPFHVRGVRVDVCATPNGYGSTNPSIVHTSSPSPSPSSTNQQMNSYHQFSVAIVDGRHHCHPLDQSPRITSNQPIGNKFESLEERPQAQVSPATDQSVSSKLCNGTAGHLNGFNCGTMGGNAGNVHQEVGVPGGSESGNDQSHVNPELTRQRSIQREAALNKFRLKRKERCYEKKVRYESRKKLAEQRPRVKGQFVRQVPPDPPPRTGNCGGNLFAN